MNFDVESSLVNKFFFKANLMNKELIGITCVCVSRIIIFQKKYYALLIYIQQDATLHSLFYLETALHVSGGTTINHQERKQLYLQHLVFVTPLLLPVATVE